LKIEKILDGRSLAHIFYAKESLCFLSAVKLTWNTGWSFTRTFFVERNFNHDLTFVYFAFYHGWWAQWDTSESGWSRTRTSTRATFSDECLVDFVSSTFDNTFCK